MRSRAARLTLSVLSWIVLAAAAAFLLQSERHINERRAALRAFDLRAHDAERVLSDVRAGQQAYVAAGQGVDFWMPQVNTLTVEAAQLVDALRASATSTTARASLMQAAATVTEFGNVDRRAREYLKADLQLMAGDVVFTEGRETAAEASRHVEAARIAEHQALDAWEGGQRRLQGYAIAAAGAFAALLIALFALMSTLKSRTRPSEAALEIASPVEDLPRTSVPALKIAAELCTEIGRVNDPADLAALLGRAAEVMDASGVVVWMGNKAGADLQPAVAHGYSPQVLARMPPVTRTADNAAAAAYRTGALQIVLARPGQSNGALVAPLLTPEGCVGALTAEIRGGGETADTTQAFAAIFAAQLASVLASSALPAVAASENRIASA
jgi:hypothetical protein